MTQRTLFAAVILVAVAPLASVRAVGEPSAVTALPSPIVQVDLPGSGPIPEAPFAVAGWALTPGNSGGPGIDSVQVWAAPYGGGDVRFLGAATLGIPRPDVAAAFGPAYGTAGYYLAAPALPAGTWQLYISATPTESPTTQRLTCGLPSGVRLLAPF